MGHGGSYQVDTGLHMLGQVCSGGLYREFLVAVPLLFTTPVVVSVFQSGCTMF